MRKKSGIPQIGPGRTPTVVNSNCRIPNAGRSSPIARRMLIERLDRIKDERIVVLVAPAGSGKTETARQLAECKSDRGTSVGWLSLRGATADIDTLLLSIIKSLSIALSRNDTISQPRLSTQQIRVELNDVINEIDRSGESVFLVMDGYEVIDRRELHDEIERFVNDIPSEVQVLITTRCSLPWPLGKYRVAEELAEFGFSQIRFDEDEVTQFVAQNTPVPLDADHLRELIESTDGWIAALKITLLALKPGQSRRRVSNIVHGRNSMLDEFLAENLFAELPSDARDLLLRCATLDILSAPLCEHVTGSEDVSQLLESLARVHLIVEPIDVEQRWYRVHPIQSRFLRSRFERKPVKFRETAHRLASEWYRENENPREAIRHALAIDDYDAVKEILRRHGQQMVEDGDIKMLTVCMESLSDMQPELEPHIALVFVWTSVVVQKYEEARIRLDRLKATIQADTKVYDKLSSGVDQLEDHLIVLDYRIRQALDPEWADSKVWEELRKAQDPKAHFVLQHVELALATTYLRRGEYNDAYTMYMSVRRNAEATNSLITSIAASLRMAQIRLIQGRMSEALELCDEILIAVGNPGSLRAPAPISGVAYLIRSQINYERNNLDRCERDLDKARSLVKQFGLAVNIVPLEILAAHIDAAKRGAIAAINRLSSADRLPAHDLLKKPLEHVWATQAWFYLQAQDMETGRSLLERLGSPIEKKGPNPMFSCSLSEERKYRALCLYLILNNRRFSASAWLTKLLHQAQATGRMASQISFGALLALCHEQGGHKDRALRALRQCLVVAENFGFLRSVLDTSPGIVNLVREFAKIRGASDAQFERGPSQEYVSKLIAVADGDKICTGTTDSIRLQQTTPVLRSDDVYSPLTPREIEILTCICDGLSNRAISEDLMIGEGTVKWHTKNIYSKLGVNSRTQASAKARAVHLVS